MRVEEQTVKVIHLNNGSKLIRIDPAPVEEMGEGERLFCLILVGVLCLGFLSLFFI